nr:unnamed protein product [Callosobruchus analis]
MRETGHLTISRIIQESKSEIALLFDVATVCFAWTIWHTTRFQSVFKLPARPIQGQAEGQKEGGVKPVEHLPEAENGPQEILPPVINRDEEVSCYAGRPSQFLPTWRVITQDQAVLDWVSGLKIPFSSRPKQFLEPKINIDKSLLQFDSGSEIFIVCG